MSQFTEFEQRIAEYNPDAIATLEILQKYCPLVAGEKITGNETITSIILRYINHFTLNTLTLTGERSIHTEKIKQIFQNSIKEQIIKAISRDNLLVKAIIELEDRKINSIEVIELITSNLTELPTELLPRKEEVLDSFKYIEKDVP